MGSGGAGTGCKDHGPGLGWVLSRRGRNGTQLWIVSPGSADVQSVCNIDIFPKSIKISFAMRRKRFDPTRLIHGLRLGNNYFASLLFLGNSESDSIILKMCSIVSLKAIQFNITHLKPIKVNWPALSVIKK